MTKLSDLEELPGARIVKQDFSKKTAEFLTWMQQTLWARGWIRTDARLQSALYNWTFEKGERKIMITGWHGTGKKGTARWFGDLKTLLTLYDNQVDGKVCPNGKRMRQVFDLNCIDGTVEQHAAHLKAIEAYIRACA
jgi:hypothetical protein